jgi:hypothetical protein
MMAAGSLHCSGYMQVGCDGGWTAEQRVLISFKKPISILSSLSPVHAVAPNGKFVGVELLNAARGNPYSFHHARATNHGVKKETVSPG